MLNFVLIIAVHAPYADFSGIYRTDAAVGKAKQGRVVRQERNAKTGLGHIQMVVPGACVPVFVGAVDAIDVEICSKKFV